MERLERVCNRKRILRIEHAQLAGVDKWVERVSVGVLCLVIVIVVMMMIVAVALAAERRVLIVAILHLGVCYLLVENST
ncbi:hypothetical protein PsorP6_000428 [Peronosclerospora sorghi]|uniref:Uncharacterized protein n=1 Tax=Peronosclerospora sorghi TaxID=230839 RepID=A0ACC0WWV6_9STRA|nr:hypothetical protein PsorP6_000428 [Peronosclerospora sorghi]